MAEIIPFPVRPKPKIVPITTIEEDLNGVWGRVCLGNHYHRLTATRRNISTTNPYNAQVLLRDQSDIGEVRAGERPSDSE